MLRWDGSWKMVWRISREDAAMSVASTPITKTAIVTPHQTFVVMSTGTGTACLCTCSRCKGRVVSAEGQALHKNRNWGGK